MMSLSRFTTSGALALLVIANLIAIPVALINPDVFSSRIAQEDGLIEYLTAIFLFAAALVLALRGVQLLRLRHHIRAGLTWLYALLYTFVAGEEISWGQRIFGWQSSDFFVANNQQAETNLHNLVIGQEQLASTLFGNWLTPVLLMYLVVLPLLYPRAAWVRRTAASLAVPVPRAMHAWLAIGASLVMVAITGVYRQYELYEYSFSLISLLIFVRPQNPGLYGRAAPEARAWFGEQVRPAE
ncbi:hypothetical protein [Pseudooceanicola algae]|uniref:Uncharacterized protein n=1 Tax=Pseudooceanicola algae TaxID=1537215 RepID=A0A418SIL4_9RHOB|nr:hypothetical protein [Pseudooceanicola algae]QPM91141.1 hypothetical protein PSAL_023900 [Pseudooceanicola algae]